MRLLAIAVATFSCASLAAAPSPRDKANARAADPPATAPANAADLYRQAFALLPKYPDLSDRERGIVAIDDGAKPTRQEYAEIAHKAGPALKLLRRAAGLESCDWGAVRKEKQKLIARMEPFPKHLSPLANLARYSRLRARWHARSGRYREAYEDWADQLALARHASRTPTTSGWRVQAFVTGHAVADAAFHLPHAPVAVIESFARRLARLPAHGSLPAAVAVERKHRLSSLSDLLASDDGRELVARQARLGEVVGLKADEPLPLDDLWDDYEKQEKVLVDLDASLATLEERVSLPDREYVASQDEFLERFKRLHPLVPRVLKDSEDTWELAAFGQARFALLQAALSVRLHGPDALKQSRDPFGNGPFRREEVPEGYRLVSGRIEGGRSATLVVGGRSDPSADGPETE